MAPLVALSFFFAFSKAFDADDQNDAVVLLQGRAAKLQAEPEHDEGQCDAFCATNEQGWDKVCYWGKCEGCPDCGPPDNCAPFCSKSEKGWDTLCNWKKCKGCKECATELDFPPPCPEDAQCADIFTRFCDQNNGICDVQEEVDSAREKMCSKTSCKKTCTDCGATTTAAPVELDFPPPCPEEPQCADIFVRYCEQNNGICDLEEEVDAAREKMCSKANCKKTCADCGATTTTTTTKPAAVEIDFPPPCPVDEVCADIFTRYCQQNNGICDKEEEVTGARAKMCSKTRCQDACGECR